MTGLGHLGKDVGALWSPAPVRTRPAPTWGCRPDEATGPGSQGLCLPFLQGHPLGLWDPSSLEVLGDPRIKHEVRQLKAQPQGGAACPERAGVGVGSRASAHPRASTPDFHPGAVRGLPAPPRTPHKSREIKQDTHRRAFGAGRPLQEHALEETGRASEPQDGLLVLKRGPGPPDPAPGRLPGWPARSTAAQASGSTPPARARVWSSSLRRGAVARAAVTGL